MTLRFKSEVTLKDALYNVASDSGASVEYCQGLIVGLVSMQMAQGLTFKQAIDTVACYYPNVPNARLIAPSAWMVDLMAALDARGKYFIPASV